MSGSLIFVLFFPLSSCLSCPTLRCYGFCIIILYYVLIPCKSACFIRRDQNEVVLNRRAVGEALEEVEGGKTIIRICYMRKEYILNKREKSNSL